MAADTGGTTIPSSNSSGGSREVTIGKWILLSSLMVGCIVAAIEFTREIRAEFSVVATAEQSQQQTTVADIIGGSTSDNNENDNDNDKMWFGMPRILWIFVILAVSVICLLLFGRRKIKDFSEEANPLLLKAGSTDLADENMWNAESVRLMGSAVEAGGQEVTLGEFEEQGEDVEIQQQIIDVSHPSDGTFGGDSSEHRDSFPSLDDGKSPSQGIPDYQSTADNTTGAAEQGHRRSSGGNNPGFERQTTNPAGLVARPQYNPTGIVHGLFGGGKKNTKAKSIKNSSRVSRLDRRTNG